jgi:hypothetical protein
LGAVGADRAVVPPEYHQPAGLLVPVQREVER